MNKLTGQKIAVIGYGISGKPVVNWLLKHGAQVVILDEGAKGDRADEIIALTQKYSQITAKIGTFTADDLYEANLIVVSPGVPSLRPELQAARGRNIEVISEIELAIRNCPTRNIIGTTGTNGKSTTVTLIGNILDEHLKSTGSKALTLGNIGTAFISEIDNLDTNDWVSLELSSYQLETTPSIHPRAAIFTNITPDHLERHKSFENYLMAKHQLSKNLTKNDFLIYNAEDQYLQPDRFPVKDVIFMPFSSNNTPALMPNGYGAYFNGQLLIFKYPDINGKLTEFRFSKDLVRLRGIHNIQNILAAGLATLSLGINQEAFQAVVNRFDRFRHRIEFIQSVNNVKFYNDSKATNPESAVICFKSFEEPIIAIMGGRDKGTPLRELAEVMLKRVKTAILIGEAKERFASELNKHGFGNYVLADSFNAAFKLATDLAKPGESIVLSPACASFDMFTSFEDRGDRFAELVKDYSENQV